MFSVERSILISRSPQEVFDLVADPAVQPKLQKGLEISEWTSEGPPGVGSTIRQVGRMMGRSWEGTGEVTEWAPPNQFRVKSTSGPVPFETRNRIESQGNGTLLTVSGQFSPGGIFRLLQPLLAWQAEKQADGQLKTLKNLLEKGQA